jgi:transposase InsO family protein
MAHENPLWGAPRIHGELLKLGVQVSQATVAKYMARPATPASQSWGTFLANHASRSWPPTSSLFQRPRTGCCSCSSSWHTSVAGSSHVAVTRHPTAAWTAQQLREAFPSDQTPGFLLHDRDLAFRGLIATAKAMGIEDVRTAPRSPWQNAYIERFIGSIRRECLDHVVVLNAAGLRTILKSYLTYDTNARTHLSLDKDSPQPRPVYPRGDGCVTAIAKVGGLHHRYERRAA